MKWFALTNRNATRNSFGNEPEPHGKLHFLSASTTNVPADPSDFDMDYVGPSSTEAAVERFVRALRRELLNRQQKLENQGLDAKPVLLLYTHGYNNDYYDSIEEYLELRRNFHGTIGRNEFERHCLPVLFTWPSAGAVTAYLEDRDDARGSYLAVKNMVYLLYKFTHDLQDCISNVSVIAHSMGNYVLREALTALAGAPNSPAGTFVDQFVSIGADIGNTSLEPNGKGFGIPRFSNRVTVYFSAGDDTLKKSKRKNGRRRLGRTLSSGYLTTPDSVAFVDCRNWANEDRLKRLFPGDPPSPHSSYRSVAAILNDMFATLLGADRDFLPGRERVVQNKHYLLR